MIRWCKPQWRLALALVFLVGLAAPGNAKPGDHKKLDKVLNGRAGSRGTSRVIITLQPGWDARSEVKRLGGTLGRRLRLIDGVVAELPNGHLRRLADHPAVRSIHHDRPTGGEMNRVAVTVGARAVQHQLGYTGAGIGVAVIDSGVTSWHDDLTYRGTSPNVRTWNGQRVAAFVDFVNGRTSPYDDHGHGTHVSGVVAGNGYDTNGVRAGIAPDAHIVSLKVLDQNARGVISDVIAALEYAIANRADYNIRVINLSVGAAVTESYRTDPLTLAAKRAVDAGIVVVTAAGNLGKNANGQTQYGAITAPGNAPWVLTVGASNHEGTVARVDDTIASFSSRGPTALDYAAKPDLVAPGVGIISLSAVESTLYTTKSGHLLKGTVPTATRPYISLSGTSMAAPVVSGTVALMMQANPSLTPNLAKAILQYTAQKKAYNSLTQGGGFLNAEGAVTLARFFATATPGATLRIPRTWSREVLWGNYRLTGGHLRPNTNAWELGTVWGSFRALDGDNIVWGTLCGDLCDNIVWGTFDLLEADNIVWGTILDLNGDNIVWGTFLLDADNIVWGTFLRDADNIVWGTLCGGADCDNMVWGTFDLRVTLDFDNIVWGTIFRDGDNIVWGTSGEVDNMVWGTSAEAGNVTWGLSGEDTPLFDDPAAEPVNFDATVFDTLFSTDGAASSGGETSEPPSATETTSPETTIKSLVGSTTGLLGGL